MAVNLREHVMLQSRCAIYEGAKERQDYHDIFSSMGCRIRSMAALRYDKAGLIGMTRSLAKELGEFMLRKLRFLRQPVKRAVYQKPRRMKTFWNSFIFGF